ncbi:unnamed protein product [Rotaria sp. Silwood2]|nr:unnamed protein product [Rotaria sp. Silwood2]CAF4521545.1 unnamed protein product [Rotaria sp. Silwood2]
MLIQHTIYLRPSLHCCNDHLDGGDIKLESLNMIKKNYPPITSIVTNDIMDIIGDLTLPIKNSTNGMLIQKSIYHFL